MGFFSFAVSLCFTNSEYYMMLQKYEARVNKLLIFKQSVAFGTKSPNCSTREDEYIFLMYFLVIEYIMIY